ncbi:phytoene desaturase [Anaerobacillus alkaliphilus]|uniref:Phytoene desaturase n=1 Tax=Anaerobacillus alkaliphilus TaxID=1548597 RepID=A0A4Q0VQX9_9BACI|nr:phytoene desaturase family protein [Anaerobacillus alkaliphilus]RXI97770.1 phytoene desaturase [Anaerobacillus alkaliphilus]
MSDKRIAVIGAGPGGLAAAMLLASSGYKVDVFEKKPYVGGRTSSVQMGDYTFDMGPTFFSMPHILEEIFAATGRKLEDYVDLVEIEPMYELKFADKSFSPSRDQIKTKKKIQADFPGNEEGYEKFMRDTEKKMATLMPILQNRHNSLFDYMRWRTIRALPKLSLNQSLYDVLSQYFTDEKLKLAFTFQSKYLGMSPWECPGAFSILSYMEHKYGIFHSMGGLNQLTKAMAKVVNELGGTIHVDCGVKKLTIDKHKNVTGIQLENGESLSFDEVVVNADFAHAMTSLVEDDILKKHSKQKLEMKDYSCSTFMLYLGVNKTFDLPHHLIVFSDDYKKNVEEITKTKKLSKDPSIYIHNPSITDPTLAPMGKSALYILAPVPNNYSLIDWEKHKHEFRKLVLEQIETKTDYKNLEAHIEEEKMITPLDWDQDIHVYRGATFNLAHHLRQMMYYRPHNQFQELNNCWLVGGGTHPGSGLPTIFESARITARSIVESHNKKKRNA